MNAIDMLKADHKKVQDLFKKFEAAKHNNDRKKQIAEKTCDELEMHTKLEENDFYPAVEATGDQGVEYIREAEQEHKIVDELISQIRTTSPESEDFDPTYKVLRENVEHHVREEESGMFPFAKRVLGAGDLDHIAHRMAERKKSLSAPGFLERAKQLVSGAVDAVTETVSEIAGTNDSSASHKPSAKTRAKTARKHSATTPAQAKAEKAGKPKKSARRVHAKAPAKKPAKATVTRIGQAARKAARRTVTSTRAKAR